MKKKAVWRDMLLYKKVFYCLALCKSLLSLIRVWLVSLEGDNL